MSLKDKITEFDQRQREADDAWSEAEDELIRIYKALEKNLYKVDGAELVEFDQKKEVCKVKFFYSDWNNYDSDDVVIPWEVITSDDPVSAAEDIFAERNIRAIRERIEKVKAQKSLDQKRRRDLYEKLKKEFES